MLFPRARNEKHTYALWLEPWLMEPRSGSINHQRWLQLQSVMAPLQHSADLQYTCVFHTQWWGARHHRGSEDFSLLILLKLFVLPCGMSGHILVILFCVYRSCTFDVSTLRYTTADQPLHRYDKEHLAPQASYCSSVLSSTGTKHSTPKPHPPGQEPLASIKWEEGLNDESE